MAKKITAVYKVVVTLDDGRKLSARFPTYDLAYDYMIAARKHDAVDDIEYFDPTTLYRDAEDAMDTLNLWVWGAS